MTNSENEMKDEKYLELQDKINQQEKIILKQQKKLNQLIRSSEYYRHNEYVKFKNQIILEDTIKHLEVLLNFIKFENVEYRIYGEFLEKILTDTLAANSTLNVYLNYSKLEKLEGLCDIYFSLGKIQNTEDYNMIKNYISDVGVNVRYFKLQLEVDSIYFINLIIHDSVDYLQQVYTTSQNLCITEYGIQSMIDHGNKNLYSTKYQLDTFFNIFLLKNRKTKLYYTNTHKKIVENEELLNCLSTQINYENNNISILNKFEYVINDCPVCLEKKKCFKLECSHIFCLECLNNHIGNNNYNNKNCPLCRSEMVLN